MSAVLLLIGAQRHYFWQHVPTGAQADVWNICGSVAILSLLALLVRRDWDWMTWAVAVWFAAEESLVAVCSGVYLISPWPVEPGAEQCSAKIGFQLGAVGIMVVALLVWKLTHPVRVDSYQDEEK